MKTNETKTREGKTINRNTTKSNTRKPNERKETSPRLTMESQTIKGGITFLVEEVNRLNILEIKDGLKQIFGWTLDDGDLIMYCEHLRDRNVLSVSVSAGKLDYKIRKVAQAELELSQVRNIVGTLPIMKQKFEKWKQKLY